MSFLYFAYGSNMLSARLKDRCRSIRLIGKAIASDHALEFSKRSVDNSGKATLIAQPATQTPGVLFEIDRSEQELLDKAEGPGYDRHDAFPVTFSSRTEYVTTYFAPERHDHLKPFDWYLALVIAGAHEHDLGADYADALRMIAYDLDTDTARKSRTAALKALAAHDHHDHTALLTKAPSS